MAARNSARPPAARTWLVTGGAGFIGSNFVHLLFAQEPNARVRVLDKLTYSANLKNLQQFRGHKNFTFIKGDICDARVVARAMAGAHVVVNFAAETAVDRSIDDPHTFLRTDVVGVHTLLQQARKEPQLKRFIQISTDEVYGQIKRGSFYETSELRPRNPYAAAKAGGDRLAYSFFATYGLPVIITRASNNYGPRAYLEKVIPLFVTNLIDGQKVPVYGAGLQIRDWLYVADHCRAIHLLVDRGINGEVYNVGGGQECTNIALVRRILKLMHHDERSIKYVQDRPGHDFRYSLDCSKLQRLGWRPEHNLRSGLRSTIDWYTANEDWWRPVKAGMEQRFFTGYWGRKR